MTTQAVQEQVSCTAFAGDRRVAAGSILEVAVGVKSALESGETEPVLVFDNRTSRVIELDLRGTLDEVKARLRPVEAPSEGQHDASEEPRRGPGRPKLGVVAREVTLLPRHWEWLNSQPGGASVALRKLVDEARKANLDKDRVRKAQESAYRFMSAMAGNQAGFEEASRALFAGQREGFDEHTESWPADVREHARGLAGVVFEGGVPGA